jgi:carboxypeptidase C (cathepsin A)
LALSICKSAQNHYSTVDQPVGTGFSYGNYGAVNNDEDTLVFMQWLGAFLAAFPTLKFKKIHVLGESYAGIFVRDEFSHGSD